MRRAHPPCLARCPPAGDLRRYVDVFLDGEDVRWLAGQETPLGHRAEVQIVPSVAGD